jgi:hypothetical protein
MQRISELGLEHAVQRTGAEVGNIYWVHRRKGGEHVYSVSDLRLGTRTG